MDNLPPFLEPGFEYEIGSYTFTKEAIIHFAEKFDPQEFHLSEETARNSLFGKLCASGWHTTSVWMKMQREYAARTLPEYSDANYAKVELGPSPGFKNLRWTRPVFSGETVTYYNCNKEIRESTSRPGTYILSVDHEAYTDQNKSELAMSFTGSVFIHLLRQENH
ncbi:MAG: MaoC/PaaZ C-terminal domain-containing protein [Rhizobiaceae bacterium]